MKVFQHFFISQAIGPLTFSSQDFIIQSCFYRRLKHSLPIMETIIYILYIILMNFHNVIFWGAGQNNCRKWYWARYDYELWFGDPYHKQSTGWGWGFLSVNWPLSVNWFSSWCECVSEGNAYRRKQVYIFCHAFVCFTLWNKKYSLLTHIKQFPSIPSAAHCKVCSHFPFGLRSNCCFQQSDCFQISNKHQL